MSLITSNLSDTGEFQETPTSFAMELEISMLLDYDLWSTGAFSVATGVSAGPAATPDEQRNVAHR